MENIGFQVSTISPAHDYGWQGSVENVIAWLAPRYRDWRDCGLTRCGCRAFTAYDQDGRFAAIWLRPSFHGLHC